MEAIELQTVGDVGESSEFEGENGQRKIPKRVIIRLLGLGVVLPSIDVYSDVYMAVKLQIAGHIR